MYKRLFVLLYFYACKMGDGIMAMETQVTIKTSVRVIILHNYSGEPCLFRVRVITQKNIL